MQTGAEEDGIRKSSVHEAAILVSRHALHKQDRGLVIVGSSLHLGDLLGQDAARALPACLITLGNPAMIWVCQVLVADDAHGC